MFELSDVGSTLGLPEEIVVGPFACRADYPY